MWIDVGSTVDANTSLPPFWQTPTSFWTTNSVKDTQVLGYAYPETQRWLYDDEIEYGSAVNASIANLYSSSVRAMLTSGPDVAGAHLSHLLVDNSFVDWDVQIQGDRRHLPSTFLLRFFLVGDFSSDPVTDVGGWAVLMPGSRVQREKMARRATTHHQDMKGVVSLTATLIDDIAAGKLESLDARYVVPYLKDRLTWKPQAVGYVLMHCQTS
jgi:tyrosinase